jgi:hypothetical protein
VARDLEVRKEAVEEAVEHRGNEKEIVVERESK